MAPNPFVEATSIIGNNLGLAESLIVLFILNVGLLIIYAKDFRIGTMLGFVLNAGLFAVYYQINVPYAPALILCMMYLVILSFTLYTQTTEPQRTRLI